MYRYYKNEDSIGAAKYYGDKHLAEQELVKLTKVLAKIIMQNIDEDPNTGLQWVISIVQQEGVEFAIRSELCRNLNYYLLPLIINQADIQTKLILVKNISSVSRELINFDPDDLENLESAAVLCIKEGDLYLLYGDLQIARIKFEEGLDLLKKLNKVKSGTEFSKNHLSKSYQRIAQLDVRFGDPAGAFRNCKKAFDYLKDKKEYIPEEIVTLRQIVDTAYKLFKFYYDRSDLSDQIKYQQMLIQIIKQLLSNGVELPEKYLTLLNMNDVN
jgi:tetratricopeptide (TPR) repeat protein